MSNEEPKRPKRAVCFNCEKSRNVKYQTVLADFCSDKCFNEYLRIEGFQHRYKDGVKVAVGEVDE